METSLLIFAILFLIFASAYFSGSEAALFSVPATRIKSFQFNSDPRKKLIASLLLHPQDLLVTVFMMNTLVNILLQNVTASFFGDFSNWTLNVGVPLVITLFFGEIIPKYIGLQTNISFSYLVAPSIDFFQKLLKPIRQITVAITLPISRIMFAFLKKEPDISKDELRHILKTSEEKGIFSREEGELIDGYLKLQDALVKEVMWPREDIIYYDTSEPLSKLVQLLVEQQCTRVPVCEKNLDNILGIISAKLFFLHRSEILSSANLKPFLVKPFYVPETIPAKALLKRFQEHRQVLGLVIDEYGSISGLITKEDLIEIVVGEIQDKRDQDYLYTRPTSNELITSGKLELDEFNEIFNTHFSSPEGMVTIGGWLIEKLGEIPKNGSKYEFNDFLFHILSATPNRIQRLYIRRIAKPKEIQ